MNLNKFLLRKSIQNEELLLKRLEMNSVFTYNDINSENHHFNWSNQIIASFDTSLQLNLMPKYKLKTGQLNYN